jgi:putative tricarboxylic transport membrane protein
MYLGNVVAVVLVLATVPIYASILRVPFSIVGPVIVAIIFSGAYQIANSTFDMWLVLGFGILGYLFKKLDYPIAPLVLAMVLGDKAEDAFRQSMLMSNGSLSIFWSNPLVTGIMALGLLMLLWPILANAVGVRNLRRAARHSAKV